MSQEKGDMSAIGDSYKTSLEVAAKYAQMWLEGVPDRGINP